MNKKFLGINLNKKCREFIAELESDFGIPISIEIVDRELAAEYGFAKIIDGLPKVELNKKSGLTPENLIHEVFHLRLRLDGYPTIGFTFNGLVQPTEDNKFWMQWLGTRLWDKILHKIFYPRMKQMGLHPYRSFTKELSKTIESGEIKNLSSAARDKDLALYYLQTFVETDKHKLPAEVEKFYRKRYGGDGIGLGRQLVGIVASKDLSTPNETIRAFRDCFNAIMPINLVEENKKCKVYGKFLDRTIFFTFAPRLR